MKQSITEKKKNKNHATASFATLPFALQDDLHTRIYGKVREGQWEKQLLNADIYWKRFVFLLLCMRLWKSVSNLQKPFW